MVYSQKRGWESYNCMSVCSYDKILKLSTYYPILTPLYDNTLFSANATMYRKSKFHVFNKKTSTVKLGDKECFDKEQIGIKGTFPVTECQFTS